MPLLTGESMVSVASDKGSEGTTVELSDADDFKEAMVKKSSYSSFGSRGKAVPFQSVNTRRFSMLTGLLGKAREKADLEAMDEEWYAPKGHFVDASAVKEQVRQNLHQHKYDVADCYTQGSRWTNIATSASFEQFTLTVIAANAIWIAVDTDLNQSALLNDAHPVFQVAENVFCSYFVMELFVRFMAFNRKLDCLRDAWFVFDSVLVVSMVLETWVMNFVALLADGGGGTGMNTSVVRIARLLRLTRMARMARLLRAMPELMIMIKGMLAATRSVFFTFCLLLMIMYVFAVAMTQITDNTTIGDKYFGSVPASMGTLLLYGTLLDDVGRIARELSQEAIWMAAIFMFFVILAALTVMNMLIGVLCEVVSVVAAIEKEEMLLTYVTHKLQKVVSMLDADGDNTISKKEFVQILNNADAVRCLSDVGVDVVGLVDFADFIFEKDPFSSEEDGEITFSKFTEVVLQFRGTNNATVKDIVDLRKFVRNAIIETHKQLANVLQAVKQTTHEVGSLTDGILSTGVSSYSPNDEVEAKAHRRSADFALLGKADSLASGRGSSALATCGIGKQHSERSGGHRGSENSYVSSRRSMETLESMPEEKTNADEEMVVPLHDFKVHKEGNFPEPQASAPVSLLRHGARPPDNRLPQGVDDDSRGPASFQISLRGQWYPCESMEVEARTAHTEMSAGGRTSRSETVLSGSIGSRSETVLSGTIGRSQASHEYSPNLSRPVWNSSEPEHLTLSEQTFRQSVGLTSSSISEAT